MRAPVTALLRAIMTDVSHASPTSQQMLETYKVVERVLVQRDAPPTDAKPWHRVEYFCKWTSTFPFPPHFST